MQSIPKLSVNNLSKSFNNSALKVLDDISLTIEKGELVSIIGPSGCGKSTLLDCIAGLTTPDKGDIYLSKRSIVNSQRNIAYMFQDDVMFPWRSILDNVIIPLELDDIKKDRARKEARVLLKEFGLEKFSDFYPFMLSGGMRERASLLRTYLCKKDVMLLDEPFSKLDALTRQKMQQWFLKVLQRKQKTVLLVTHDIEEAIYLSDRIYVMSKEPGAIKAEIKVTFKKPRLPTIVLQSEFLSIKKKIMHFLNY